MEVLGSFAKASEHKFTKKRHKILNALQSL